MKQFFLFLFSAGFITLNAQQPVAWQAKIGGNETEYSNAIDTAKDGSIYAAGFIRSRSGEYTMQYTASPDPLSPDAWIVKYNKFGVLQWQKVFGGTAPDEFYDVKATPDGGAIAVGRSGSTDGNITNNKGGEDIVVAKYDAAGNLEWNQNYGSTLLDGARTITVMTDSSYVLGCYSNGANKDFVGGKGGRDVWMLQLSTTGAMVRKKNFGGSNDDDPFDIKFYNNDTWIITGNTGSLNGDVTGFHGGTDVWVLKLDAAWNLQKQKCFGGTGQDGGYGVVVLPDGYAIAARVNAATGDVTALKGGYDGWMIKTDFELNIAWTKTYGGAGNDYFSALTVTKDGSLLAAGETNSSNDDITLNAGISDAWLIKIDQATGTKIWSQTFGATKADRANDILVWGNDDYLFGGMFSLVIPATATVHAQLWLATSKQFPVVAPLPVTLLSFEGKQSGAVNTISWQTSSEVGSKEYRVERSEDGATFSAIGVVPAVGNSSVTQAYSFTDVQPLQNGWYRLQMIDKDGRETRSRIIVITRSGATEATRVYPTITSSFITVEIKAENNKTTMLVIADATGRVLHKETKQLTSGLNHFTIDVSRLAKGVYYLLLTGNDKSETIRFIKQ